MLVKNLAARQGICEAGTPISAPMKDHFRNPLEKSTTADGVVILSNMKTVALFRRCVVVAADAFAEVVIWRAPAPIPPSRHHFKYRLPYVVSGACVVRYDTEQGKGDHRHFGSGESDCVFID